jgi:hypothetical protein
MGGLFLSQCLLVQASDTLRRFALVAMIFLSLSVLAVEAKLGVASPDTSWTLAGE